MKLIFLSICTVIILSFNITVYSQSVTNWSSNPNSTQQECTYTFYENASWIRFTCWLPPTNCVPVGLNGFPDPYERFNREMTVKWKNIEASAFTSILKYEFRNNGIRTFGTVQINPFNLSFPTVTFVGGSNLNIPCSSTNPVTIALNSYVNTENNGIDMNLEITSHFEWTLPLGWQTTTGQTGTFVSSSSINVIPPASASATSISVRAKANTQYSNSASLQISRNLDASDILISGPSHVCSFGATFSINNLPPVNSIVWSCGPNLTISSGQNTASCTFSATGAGNSWVSAMLVTNCGSIMLPQKDIYAAKLVAPVVRNTKYSGEGEPMQIQFTANQFTEGAPNTYNWYVNNTLVESNYNDNIFIRYIPCGHTINVKCKISNVCMTSPYSSNHTLTNDCSRYLVLLITPNPSINEAIISIESASKESFDLSTPWELEVYDQMQIMKEKKTAIRGKQTKIDITNWKDGVYIVRAKIGEEIISGKLLVKP